MRAEPIPRRARIECQPGLARRPRRVAETAVVRREDVRAQAGRKCLIMPHARRQRTCIAIPMQEEDCRVSTQGGADEVVGKRGGGRGTVEICLVGDVEGIREGEPGAEGLVVGSVYVYVASFECCEGRG